MSNTFQPRISLVVIQPSPFCNIDCRYCYLADRANQKVIDERTLDKIFERVFESEHLGERFSLLWHAGEPLAVPVDFYEKACARLRQFNRRNIRIKQHFQTNATLINQAWCDFFTAHEAHVSVSIDGPRQIHDANRVTRSGRGTFEQAMRGVRLMQQNGMSIHNIAVLTRASLEQPDEMWNFFLSEGITNLKFNVEEVEGIHAESSVRDSEDRDRYQAFFRRIAELRKRSGAKVWIRELDQMADRVRFGSDELESELNVPLATLSFDCEGNVSTFSPELLTVRHAKYQHFKFGNVFTSGVDEILHNELFLTAHADIERGVSRCRAECPYFSVCGGGEPSNKLAENGTFDCTETMHCRLTIQSLCDLVVQDEESASVATFA